jgi:hypothetical protein
LYCTLFECPVLSNFLFCFYDFQSNESVETISVMSMAHALRPVKQQSMNNAEQIMVSQNQNCIPKSTTMPETSQNGFPINALENIVSL